MIFVFFFAVVSVESMEKKRGEKQTNKHTQHTYTSSIKPWLKCKRKKRQSTQHITHTHTFDYDDDDDDEFNFMLFDYFYLNSLVGFFLEKFKKFSDFIKIFIFLIVCIIFKLFFFSGLFWFSFIFSNEKKNNFCFRLCFNVCLFVWPAPQCFSFSFSVWILEKYFACFH